MKYFSPQPMHSSAPAVDRKRASSTAMATGTWTSCEHKRFLAAIELYPQGPWKAIAKYVGTRTPRQAQTHAQKYREKLLRQEMRPLVPTTSDHRDNPNVKLNVETLDVVQLPSHEIKTDVICTAQDVSEWDAVLPMDDAMAFLVDLVDCSEWPL
ncbi:hypothetical protein DYB32_009288 [Aphanomyces invadans]|uniref:Uncharacterized protein n=1 Tax=Aphanomyces invadans TaxID=157072 RepID=A0A418AIQ7_9STRA|nr:hypothetical protein DYB32_009288 [Aphanomyces invadans]